MTFGTHRFIPVLLAALISNQITGQEVTGNITGAVVDASGAVVVSARVIVTETARGLVLRDLRTNEAGFYSASLLPVGVYSVIVEATGFKRTRRDGIELNSNVKHSADFKLEVGDLSQEVTVEAQMRVEMQTPQQSA